MLTHFVTILWNSLSNNNLLFRSFVRSSHSLWSSLLFFVLEQSWSQMQRPEYVIKNLMFKFFDTQLNKLDKQEEVISHFNKPTRVYSINLFSGVLVKRCFIKFYICVPTPAWNYLSCGYCRHWTFLFYQIFQWKHNEFFPPHLT